MLLGAFGRGMGLMELGAAEQGGSDAGGDGENLGGQEVEQWRWVGWGAEAWCLG